MRVAIPLFGDEISRRMGGRMRVLVASIVDEHVIGTMVEDIDAPLPERLAELLVLDEVDTVICGGLREADLEALERAGIEVISGVIGPALAAAEAFASHMLNPGQYVWRKPGRARLAPFHNWTAPAVGSLSTPENN